MQLISNILRVVFSNMITLISNVVLGIVVPIFLSVESYGEYKLYLFYVGYLGVLHFGFLDSLYLKYGGINKDIIKKSILIKEHNVFFKFQLIITILMLLVAFLLKNLHFVLLALTLLPINMGSFHKLFYQATGQFRKYSYITITYTIVNLILICMLLLYKETGFVYYIIATMTAYYLIYIILEIDFYKYTKATKERTQINLLLYFKVGIFVLVGNVCVMLITSVGSWIVQFFMSIKDFAYYSFAVSMMGMILIIINAIGLTFYNYISKEVNNKKLIFAKELLILLGVFAGSTYFILDFIINRFLPHYEVASEIIAISFLTFPYLMIIKILIINLYKARKQERKYLKVVLSIFLISLILNLIAYLVFHSMKSIAFASLLTFVIWYVYSTCIDFKYLQGSQREVIYLGLHGLTFTFCSGYLTWFVGILLYIIVMLFLSIIFYKEEIIIIWKIISQKIKVVTSN
jgi:O-antigen/teichoic acid export membrane protein